MKDMIKELAKAVRPNAPTIPPPAAPAPALPDWLRPILEKMARPAPPAPAPAPIVIQPQAQPQAPVQLPPLVIPPPAPPLPPPQQSPSAAATQASGAQMEKVEAMPSPAAASNASSAASGGAQSGGAAAASADKSASAGNSGDGSGGMKGPPAPIPVPKPAPEKKTSAKKRCGGRKCVKPKVPQCKKGPDGKRVSIDGKHKCWEPCKEGKCPKGAKKASFFNPGSILNKLNKNNVKMAGLPLTNLATVEDTPAMLEVLEASSDLEGEDNQELLIVEDGGMGMVLLEIETEAAPSTERVSDYCIFDN